MLLYSRRWLFLYPGALLMIVGVAVGMWLLPGPRTVGSVTFDVHSLLYAAAATWLGFQALCFAAFTKIFAVTEGLLPEDPRLDRAFKVLTLEVGLVIGFALIALGLIGSGLALSTWSATHFGQLDYSRTLRLTIPFDCGSHTRLPNSFRELLPQRLGAEKAMMLLLSTEAFKRCFR